MLSFIFYAYLWTKINKDMKRIYKILLIIAAVILVVLTGASIYMLNYALGQDETYSQDAEEAELKEKYPWTAEWVDSLLNNEVLKDTFIVNDKNEKLHAFYLSAKEPTKKTAVLVHGYKDCAFMMLRYGYIYNTSLNYNILVPDLHAHGLSEGKNIQMGWKDRLDVLRWISVADEVFGGNTKIVVHGLSMGAATTMMTSGEEAVPNCVKAFIEDCGYTSVWDEFSGEIKNQFGLPAFPLLNCASLACQLRYGWNFKEASALKQVAKCKHPMLFIHGDNDDFVPSYMVHPLHEAHPGPKDIWIAKGSAHAMAYHDHPEEYVEVITNYLNKYIK